MCFLRRINVFGQGFILYQSAGKPCPFPKTISGARESAIPQIVNVLSPESCFPNLKSTSCNQYIQKIIDQMP